MSQNRNRMVKHLYAATTVEIIDDDGLAVLDDDNKENHTHSIIKGSGTAKLVLSLRVYARKLLMDGNPLPLELV
eukprot:scaffold421810_cov79-Attheya_sp.AAC.1